MVIKKNEKKTADNDQSYLQNPKNLQKSELICKNCITFEHDKSASKMSQITRNNRKTNFYKESRERVMWIMIVINNKKKRKEVFNSNQDQYSVI